MKNNPKVLHDILGVDGLEVIQKAIFRRKTLNVADPLELYLPLLVVPRAILSWLVQNINPLKVGEYKDMKLPGRDDITLHIEKQNTDTYRGEFISGGKVIHDFDKQTLPSLGGHFMTVLEDYGHLSDDNKPKTAELVQEHERLVDVLRSPSHEDDQEEAKVQEKELKELKAKQSQGGIVHAIMGLSGESPSGNDAEAIKWATSHANVKELSSIIGKLVDALVSKQIARESMDKKEIKAEKQKVESSDIPEEIRESNFKDKKNDSAIIDNKDGTSPILSNKELKNLATDNGPADCKQVKEGERAAKGKIEKQDFPMKASQRSLRDILPTKQTELNPSSEKMSPQSAQGKEPLAKPYVSDAQRRWAHSLTGTHALGGKKKVAEWDKESKGKKLPEKVAKRGLRDSFLKTEMPKGRATPQAPVQAQQPKPPVGPTKTPAGAAARQSQAAMRGKQSAPKMPYMQNQTPGATPQSKLRSLVPVKPKVPTVNKSERRGKSHILSKNEIFTQCQHCHQPEFKEINGQIEFSPCACFRVMRKDENGKPFNFVTISKNNDGHFNVSFSPKADADTIKAFLLTLKAKLLIRRQYGLS